MPTTYSLALIVSVLGVLSFLMMLKVSHSISQALPLALDFWMAAGLLKLSHDSDWQSILIAATIIAVRKLVMFSLNSKKAFDPEGR